MKNLVLAILLIGILGCGQSEPTLAGGKPVSYWIDSMHSPDATLRKKAMMM